MSRAERPAVAGPPAPAPAQRAVAAPPPQPTRDHGGAPPPVPLGAWNRTLWLIGGALILVVLGVSSIALVSEFTQPPAPASASVALGSLTSDQIASKLIGRRFTRDVTPPELADATPLRSVFVRDSIPGLVGESTTSTPDQGTTVTYYVFADPAWAEAFFSDPPIPYGCGICSSSGGGVAAPHLGDRATTYVLYKKVVGGEAWIATTTYVLNGPVVINALHVPVSNAASYPNAYDLAAPANCLVPALKLLGSLKT